MSNAPTGCLVVKTTNLPALKQHGRLTLPGKHPIADGRSDDNFDPERDNFMKNFHTYLLLAGLSAAVVLTGLAGCSTSDSRDERSKGQYSDDKRLSAEVKDELERQTVYKYDNVMVQTFNGTVQLSGFVNTEEQKQQAEEFARQVRGVNEVVNNITIKPQIPSTATGRSQ